MRFLGVIAITAASCGVITGIEPAAPPTTSERATPFSLADSANRATSLDALLANGDVAIVFYRGHW